MAAPKGNKFWMLRSKHGRDKLFATPELLWDAACEYFQWCDENPWTTRKAIQKTVPVRVTKGKEIVTENQQHTQQRDEDALGVDEPAGPSAQCGAKQQQVDDYGNCQRGQQPRRRQQIHLK